MRTTPFTAFFAGLLALLPLSASALESEEVSTYVDSSLAAASYVVSSLAAGTSPEDIIRALVDSHGMTLPEATVFAMVAAGQANHAAFATAGIRQAGSLEEAREVADAVQVVDESIDVATAVGAAVNKFVAAPQVYENNYSSVGGTAAVSPAF
jgi:hypothetical protein